MELHNASTLAHALMAKHGLLDKGWRFKFTSAESRLGSCSYKTRSINLSRQFTGAATEEQVEQVILHEIAHALVGPRDEYGRRIGHGHLWKRKAREIGYTGGRTAENPYHEQLRQQRAQAAAAAPAVAPTTNADPFKMLPAGTRVAFDRHVGTITGFGRTRYQVTTDDGRRWGVSRAAVKPLPDQTPPAGAPTLTELTIPAQPKALPGQKVRITGSRHAGQILTVQKINRSRYSAVDQSGATWAVPFELAELVA